MRYMVIIICSVLLSACSPSLTVNFAASKGLNPDENQQSLPVLVKVYQLTDDQVFKQASFNGLWLQPQQVLGDVYLSDKDVIVIPDSSKSIDIKAQKGVKYLGFVAVFRMRNRANWRVIEPITWYNHSVDLQLRGNTLKVE